MESIDINKFVEYCNQHLDFSTFKEYVEQYLKQAIPDSLPSLKLPVESTLKEIYRGTKYIKDGFKGIGGSSFHKAIDYLNEKTLSREYIFSLFREGKDDYLAFVATMLWGGIGIGIGADNIKRAMSEKNEQKVIEAVSSVRKLLSNQNDELKEKESIREAFESFCPKGKNKIPGVDISFFTKLLFFLGENCNIRPLIYDNQLQQVHLALIKDDDRDLRKLCSIIKLYVNGTKVDVKLDLHTFKTPFDAYWDFINRMHKLANDKYSRFLMNSGSQGKAGRLEEILFGASLIPKENKHTGNPRWAVQQYLETGSIQQIVPQKVARRPEAMDIHNIGVLQIFTGNRPTFSYCEIKSIDGSSVKSLPILSKDTIPHYSSIGKDYVCWKFKPDDDLKEARKFLELLLKSID